MLQDNNWSKILTLFQLVSNFGARGFSLEEFCNMKRYEHREIQWTSGTNFTSKGLSGVRSSQPERSSLPLPVRVRRHKKYWG